MTIFEINKTKQITAKILTQEQSRQEGAGDKLGACCLNSGHDTYKFNMPFINQSVPAKKLALLGISQGIEMTSYSSVTVRRVQGKKSLNYQHHLRTAMGTSLIS